MKQDKYCKICRRKVAKLYRITLDKCITNDYLVCSECIDAIQNYINRRLVR